MILIINTTPVDHLEIILANKKDDFKVKKINGRFSQAEKLLPAIDRMLQAQKTKPEKLRAVGVVSGPGGFTAVRIGVAVANGLGYALNLPIIGIKGDEFADDKELVLKIFERAKSVKPAKLVMPHYDREPNITIKKTAK